MAPEPPGATAEVDGSAIAGDPAPTRPVKIDGAPLIAGRGEPLVPPEAEGSSFDEELDHEPATRKVRRARRVKRVIRRIELWSVLKLALVFYTCMYVVVMGALVIIWGFAYSAGLVDNFESFANDVGFEHWTFYGEHMFRQAAVIGGVMVVAATVLTVLATALVNVISELTGGIRVVVIEEDIIEIPIDAPRRNRGGKARAPRPEGSGATAPAPRGVDAAPLDADDPVAGDEPATVDAS